MEFQRNWGLGAVHAQAAFNAGGTGQGITIAVIDTGVDPNQADLGGAVSPASTDIVPGRNNPAGVALHGTEVAGVIGARFNGFGTIGVAYQSTILSIRADDTTGTSCTNHCQFNDFDTANAIEYAISHGAKIINMSFGADTPDSQAFTAALRDAVAAGVVVTASAGNDAAADPGWPARYAVDSRFAGSVMAVGATDQTGALASFSDQAGVAANGYIAAPGQGIVTNCTASNVCVSVSGTSFSSPHVAGALALLLQAFPNLSGRDAVDILFRTADDAGAAGTDIVYGRGILNIARAFQPIGTTSLMTAQGTTIDVSTPPGAHMGEAFGGGFGRGGPLVTVGHDSYRRLFQIDLSGFPNGAYIAKFDLEGVVITKIIIKD